MKLNINYYKNKLFFHIIDNGWTFFLNDFNNSLRLTNDNHTLLITKKKYTFSEKICSKVVYNNYFRYFLFVLYVCKNINTYPVVSHQAHVSCNKKVYENQIKMPDFS